MTLTRRTLALAAPFAALAGSAFAAGPQVFTIPFLMPRSHPYILIGINGKGPFRFILDSGAAGNTVIDSKLVRELQLPDYDVERHVGVVGGAKEAGLYAAEEVNFGGAFKQRHVAMAGLGSGKAKSLGFDGLIPAKFFLNRPSELDFEKGEFRVYPDSEPDRTGFRPLRFIPQYQDQIIVDAAFNGIPCRLQVDTGASGGLTLQPRFVLRNQLWDAFPRHIDSGIRGVTGQAGSRNVKGESLEFGGFRFRNPIVTLVDPSATSRLEEDGLIGIDFLRRFTLSFDGAGHAVWLKPNRFIGEPLQYDRVGVAIEYYPHRQSAYVIDVEADGCGAKAGLKVGDRLPGVGSVKEADDLLWTLGSALTGDVLDLKIERAGQPQTIKIAVDDRL